MHILLKLKSVYVHPKCIYIMAIFSKNMSIFGQFYLLTNVLYDIYNVQTCTYKPGRMFVHEVVDTSVLKMWRVVNVRKSLPSLSKPPD